jgi:hypothetical protein
MGRGWVFALALFAGGLVGAGATSYFILTPRDVASCIVQEMKGQAATMQWQVSQLCFRRFHEEMEISRDDYTVGFFSASATGVLIKIDSPKAKVTMGEFVFSGKVCSESKDEDFRLIKRGKAYRNNIFSFEEKFDPVPGCVRTVSIMGRYL